jgi:hypothetical protein
LYVYLNIIIYIYIIFIFIFILYIYINVCIDMRILNKNSELILNDIQNPYWDIQVWIGSLDFVRAKRRKWGMG